MEYIMIHDLKPLDDPQGRTYREINLDKVHLIPMGELVELPSGVRLFVVYHGRDCDGTPLYYLSSDKDDTTKERPSFKNPGWDGGYSESSLVKVQN